VRSLDEITKIIIPHFENYPLITKKQSDFLLFKEIAKLMDKGEHLTKDGLIKIISIKASLNKGLSDNLKLYFPNVIGIERSNIDLPINIDYNWIAGFFSGECCFLINISKALENKIGYSVFLRVSVNQHVRDKLLLKALANIIDCGNVYKHSKDAIVFMVFKIEDINNKIIPFFNKYKIKGIKYLDFIDFCVVAKLINEKTHLTKQGLEKIILIKSKLNKARYFK
jgi:LAGLIDADG endonuclease